MQVMTSYKVRAVTFDELENELNKARVNGGTVKWVLESPLIEPASFILIVEYPFLSFHPSTEAATKDGS